MIKNIINIFVILIVTSVASNAQFFVEGNANFSYRFNEETEFNNQYSRFSIRISPKAGYWLNDHFAVGANVSYSIFKAKWVNNNPDLSADVSEDIRSGYGFAVFCRYRKLLPKNFSLLLESSLGVSKDIEKRKEKKDAPLRKLGTISYTDVVIFPAISYDLSDRFSIISRLEFLSFGLHFVNTKIEDTGQNKRQSYMNFNTQSTILGNLSNINLGFIYNF